LNRLQALEATEGDIAFLTTNLKSIEVSMGQSLDSKASVGLDLGGAVATLNSALGGEAKTGIKVDFAEGKPVGLTTFVEASANGAVKAGLAVPFAEQFGTDSEVKMPKLGVVQEAVVVRVEARQPFPVGVSFADFQRDPKAAALAAIRVANPESSPLTTRTLTVSSETVSAANGSAHQTELTVEGKSSAIGSASSILLALSNDIEGLQRKLTQDDTIDLRSKTNAVEKHGFKEAGISVGRAELSATAQAVKNRKTSSRHSVETRGAHPSALPSPR
jgi:hypothetical protein